ncbi:MAG TPA: RdgB/HAM1 family non-canonical purine NTP pyrophosphatase [Burkholderiales bacterium]|jgi:XTP/dITP diphosphohydrolase|nr:RdgB/HAM1 family non-canonical purine NTP pyrophosphatase [Burkholderiales bacterium]
MIKKLVVASGNAGKLREIAEILAPLEIELVVQAAFNVREADEPHETFIENALAKARHAALITGLPALADDSGVCVEALGGAPGVLSARFAGEPRSDERNNQRLLAMLENEDDRRAYYYCVVVLMRHARDPRPLIGEGEWHGEILRAPRGAGGFGYDPLFLDPASGLSAAELSPERKNRVSHRGKALAALAAALRARG